MGISLQSLGFLVFPFVQDGRGIGMLLREEKVYYIGAFAPRKYPIQRVGVSEMTWRHSAISSSDLSGTRSIVAPRAVR
jgi:hypothetical protein